MEDEARYQVLVVSDSHSLSENVESVLRDAGLSVNRVASMEAGCAFACTGKYQVVVTAQAVFDGTWRRLTDLANRLHPGFVVIVVTPWPFDSRYYADALGQGVFEMFDASNGLGRLGEAARCATWAAYLEGAGPLPEKARQAIS